MCTKFSADVAHFWQHSQENESFESLVWPRCLQHHGHWQCTEETFCFHRVWHGFAIRVSWFDLRSFVVWHISRWWKRIVQCSEAFRTWVTNKSEGDIHILSLFQIWKPFFNKLKPKQTIRLWRRWMNLGKHSLRQTRCLDVCWEGLKNAKAEAYSSTIDVPSGDRNHQLHSKRILISTGGSIATELGMKYS